MKLRELTDEQVIALRTQVVLNSLYLADYENDFEIDANAVYLFFMGYLNYLTELEDDELDERLSFPMFLSAYDNKYNLLDWYHMHEEFEDDEVEVAAAEA